MDIKINIHHLLIVIGIAISFDIFDAFFFWLPIKPLQYLKLGLTFFFLSYFLLNYKNNWVSYFILLNILLMINSMYWSHLNFNQPYSKGFAAEKYRLLVSAGFLIYNKIRISKYSIDKLFSTIIYLAWAAFIFYLFIYLMLFLNPNFVLSFGSVEIEIRKGHHLLRFPVQILLWSAIYYFIKFFYLKQFKFFLYFSLFLLYITIVKDARGLTLFTLFSTALFVLFNSNIVVKIKYLYYVTIFIFFLLLINFNATIEFFQHYSSAITTFLIPDGGIEDTSSAIKLQEVATALIWLGNDTKHWLFGAGNLASSFNDSFAGLFGHFYISDIGILGMIFCYGLLMFTIFKINYLKLFFNISSLRGSTLSDKINIQTFQYFNVIFFFSALQTGADIFKGVQIVSTMIGVYLILNQRKKYI